MIYYGEQKSPISPFDMEEITFNSLRLFELVETPSLVSAVLLIDCVSMSGPASRVADCFGGATGSSISRLLSPIQEHDSHINWISNPKLFKQDRKHVQASYLCHLP